MCVTHIHTLRLTGTLDTDRDSEREERVLHFPTSVGLDSGYLCRKYVTHTNTLKTATHVNV